MHLCTGAYAPNERTNKTHVIQLGTIGTWGTNATLNQYLSLARYATWRVNNQYDILPDVELELYVFIFLFYHHLVVVPPSLPPLSSLSCYTSYICGRLGYLFLVM